MARRLAMLRFWFLRPSTEERIRDVLFDGNTGCWVTRADLEGYGTYWPNGKFGHAIFGLEPGVLLNPSHMGKTPLRGMHGYRPDHADSDAALLTDFEPEAPVDSITDLYGLIRRMAAWAAEARLCVTYCL